MKITKDKFEYEENNPSLSSTVIHILSYKSLWNSPEQKSIIS